MIVKLIHFQTEALANTFSSFNKGFGFKKRVKIMCSRDTDYDSVEPFYVCLLCFSYFKSSLQLL